MNASRHLLRCALVLALFVVGEIAASAHFAFVRHRVCAEHGELEHTPTPHAELVHAALEAVEHARGPTLAPGDADTAGHDHCPLSDKLAPRTPPIAFHAELALGAALPAPLAPCSAAVAIAFPLHLLAPKHSPPAVS